jgi:hypothetical protein
MRGRRSKLRILPYQIGATAFEPDSNMVGLMTRFSAEEIAASHSEKTYDFSARPDGVIKGSIIDMSDASAGETGC